VIRLQKLYKAFGDQPVLRGLELDVATLALPYPSADRLPLPTAAPDAEFRPMWEQPSEMSSRAAADLAADPTIREYSGAVDLLLPHVADVDLLLVHLAPVSRAVVAAAPRLRAVGCARGGPVNVNVPPPILVIPSGLPEGPFWTVLEIVTFPLTTSNVNWRC